MPRSLRLRVFTLLVAICLLLCFSFGISTKTALASCRYGQTNTCVSTTPTTMSYLSGGGHCISFDIGGYHWQAGDTVKLSIVSIGALGTTTADATGHIQFHVSAVCGVSKGFHTLKALDKVAALVANATFKVV